MTLEINDRVLHGFRLMRSYELYGTPPVFPSWTYFCKVNHGVKRVALVSQLLVDASYSGMMTTDTWSVLTGSVVERTFICPAGGRAHMIEMLQDLLDLQGDGEWAWGSRGSTLVSVRAAMTWLLYRTWDDPVRIVKVRRKVKVDPDAWVSAGTAHLKGTPGWKVEPLPEDDPSRYYGYLDRINAAPVETIGMPVKYLDSDEISVASTVGGDDGWPPEDMDELPL
mgnify:CR=1 FL=1|tara:strand:+ start:9557 stop:10228 length:672 start_codon:yes stop_codon:yes gene_type:complete